ncbi:hypothetical protein C7S16_5664 [Burkholderia thailandensis]|uniref:Uncharacterized protein n=1 Tax=Burkholderia thailandensis TaxID=57975 RepID=A0AAW9CUR7_BURTH|nr:hypothetical protein [Burkholderia thailandensis]MDW9251514.1 hypothetical protein [Burkholderia thailandensis]
MMRRASRACQARSVRVGSRRRVADGTAHEHGAGVTLANPRLVGLPAGARFA